MKYIYVIAIVAFAFSCSKNNSTVDQENFEKAPSITYDTTAIDSFGPGATSEAVMAKINAVAIKREKDSLAAIAKAEQEKLDKEKAKLEAEKAKETKQEIPKSALKTIDNSNSSITENPPTNP